MFYFIYFFVGGRGGGCFVYFSLDCIHICVTLAQRCSHAIWMLRSAPSAPDGNLYGDGRQKRDCSKVRHRNGFQFFFIYLFIFVAAVVVVPALEKSHESEISSIMSRAGRTGIASDSFRWPDVVFINAVFFFPSSPPLPLSPPTGEWRRFVSAAEPTLLLFAHASSYTHGAGLAGPKWRK